MTGTSPDETPEDDPGAAVAVDPRLLQIMACPDCHGGVRQVGDTVECEQCGRVYPVRGVPVMLIEESTPGA